MSFSFKLKSHVKKDEAYEDGQLLVNHLKGVTNIALNTSRMHGVSKTINTIIEIIGMSHDFGKASHYFQYYLQNRYRGDRKDHGEISAYFAYYLLPEEWKLIGFMCVKKHHGNLNPKIDLFDYNEKKLQEIAASIHENIDELNQIYGQDISPFFELMKTKQFLKDPRKKFRLKYGEFTIEDFVWTQYLYSLLLTGDKSQLIRKEENGYENSTDIYETYVLNHKNKVRKKLVKEFPNIINTDLFTIREQIYNDIVEHVKRIDLQKHHVFSINVPTGTGKTLSVYAAAFKLLERLYNESNKSIKPTIVYTIPFTSIIDQNYEVLENILKTNNKKQYDSYILKHHSMTELKYIGDEASEYKNYDARFCVENWQSTIITTTFVQLFNSIFQCGKNAIINRFHKLTGSIIILDEVQAIPPKYYEIIERIFNVLCEQFNCYVITVTATKPLFLKGLELVHNHDEVFKKMDRIIIENYTSSPKTVNEFCEIVIQDIQKNQDKSFLIVLNTVQSSLDVFKQLNESDRLKGRKKLYLSSEIYPKRRLEIIDKVKKETNTQYVVVSTQLIEAGVDLDFDCVYRDFSTIDSINQTAGRANRNAIKGKGIVKLFSLINVKDNDKRFARYIYSHSLLDATEQIIKERKTICERDILEINNAYFKAVSEKKSQDSSKQLLQLIKDFDFEKIRKEFKLIDDNYNKVDIIINQNKDTQKRLDLIEAGTVGYQEMINAWRYLNQYKVSVKAIELENINTQEIKGVHVLDSCNYDINKGITRTNTYCH